MSLDTLLEAARYLENIENGDASSISNHVSLDSGSSSNNSTTSVIRETKSSPFFDNGSNEQFGLKMVGQRGGDQTQAQPCSSPNTIGGHLRLDPNLPISFQFHTYSSSIPPSTVLSNSNTTRPSAIVAIGGSAAMQSSGGIFNNHHHHHQQSLHSQSPTSTNQRSPHQIYATVSPGGSSQLMNSNSGQGTNSMATTTPTGRSSKGRRLCISEFDANKDPATVSSRHRELHKTLEKNRRAHLRHCFEQLKEELPKSEYNDKKTSHINIIHCAIRYIQHLKRTDVEYEHEIERLARTKLRFQNQIAQLKDDLLENDKHNHSDIDIILRQAAERIIDNYPNDSANLVDNLNNINNIGNNNKMNQQHTQQQQLGPSYASMSPGSSTMSAKSPIFGIRTSEDGEHSDGDVIVELEAGEEYDDETTTTASECADESVSSGSFNASACNSTPMLNQCHA